MKKLIVLSAFFLLLVGLVMGWSSIREAAAQIVEIFYGDPDLGPFETSMSREEFMAKRADEIAFKRGVEKDKPFDPQKRIAALKQLERQEIERIHMADSPIRNSVLAAWTEIGPNPIPNGQVVGGSQLAVSGRVISIAVHPTNPDIVYVGTAQGGLYRTVDGGTTWIPLMDNAMSLAIGAIAIAPSQPETIYVGTGEHNFSSDSFFGVGVYRIDNASTAAALTGPLNKDGSNADVFTGRGISRIIVHPTDPATIFVATTSGFGGLIAASNTVLPSRGIYRSTDATSANPTFAKLNGLAGGVNASVRDIAIDPLNPNLMVANSIQISGAGGIYVSTDALSASPTFTQRSVFNGSSTSQLTAEFAVHHASGQNPTFYAATGNDSTGSTTSFGRLLVSTDGGTTWTQKIDNNFCGGQCFYDIAVAVDPTDVNRVYLGGTGTSTTFTVSSNGGTSFTSSASGLHTDSHVIAVAPSLPTTIYFGSDGGIYKSTDSGTTWVSLNNSTFRATQFMGLSVHPTDPNFTIGGTQDNGTNFYRPDGTWNRADFGDGGYSVIDQSATGTSTVNMFHTYFNDVDTLQGYAFLSNGSTPSEGTWTRRGCGSAGATVNGITCNGAIRFYAPLEQGPGTPNTIYYGSDRLYRSADNGLTHTVVSQNPIVSGIPLSAIGISPQNDSVRIAGLSDGALWGTTTGAATLTNLDALNAVPNSAIARAVIDPQNADTAYVTLSAFGVTNVWRTNNLSSAAPTWAAVAGGLPQVPVNAFLVDPAVSSILYAGTDIGVYVSTDSGASWAPFGTGLPRVAVFDMAKAPGNVIRIATHGRGMWQIASIDSAPTILGPVTATLVSESCLPANGSIDPGETVTVAFAVRNTGSVNSAGDVGTLAATGGVMNPGGAQSYGVVVAGGSAVSRNFTFTASPTLLCGTNITATIAHQDGATNLGGITYTLPTGGSGSPVTTSYTGPPVAVPDNIPAGANIVLPVSGVTGLIGDLNFRLDALAGCNNTIGNLNASMTHTFLGDLAFKLTSPAGTTVNLIVNRGGNGVNYCTVLLDDDGGFPSASTIPTTGGVTGSFAPESPLSAFDGQNANGNWTLNVADTGAVDIGTLNRYSLIITPRVCSTQCAPLANVTVSGRVVTPDGRGLRNAVVSMTDAGGVRRNATTSSFGLYQFADVAQAPGYFIGVSSKRYRFATRQVDVSGNLSNVDFVGQE